MNTASPIRELLLRPVTFSFGGFSSGGRITARLFLRGERPAFLIERGLR